jgi:NADPH2:quinone reductase
LGAELAINYRSQDFVESVSQATLGIGTNVILDSMGGSYLERNLSALAVDGRVVLIGLMGGSKTNVDLGRILSKRLCIIGSVLRSQTPENKAKMILDFQRRFGIALDQGRLRPIVDRVFPMTQVSDAHRWLETQNPFGKVILTI